MPLFETETESPSSSPAPKLEDSYTPGPCMRAVLRQVEFYQVLNSNDFLATRHWGS